MHQLKYFVLACVALFLSACQTVPLYESSKQKLAEPTSKDQGVVRVTGFHIPKDEPGTTLLLVLAAAGGADINYPVFASIFDITEETRYLGTLGVYGPGRWLEARVAPGKRRLMLTLAGRTSVVADTLLTHTDFVEVDVKPGDVGHVALSRYGFARHAYFGEVEISGEHRERCLAFAGKRSERIALVEKYMAEHQISPYAKDFKTFCLLLSDPKIVQEPAAEAIKQFAQHRERIEKLRNENYEKWKTEAEKRAPYNLMRIYEPPPEQSL